VLYPEHGPHPAHDHISVPPPDIQAEEGLDEKERVRRAEERLLPSQPPIDVPGASSSSAVVHPSMPPAESEDLYGAEDATPPALSNGFHPSSYVVSADATLAPSAPALEDLTPTNTQTLDDKQELERRRLLAEASSPSGPPADEDDNAGEGSSSQQFEPSAPILPNDDYDGQYSHHGFSGSSRHETLPKYER